MSQMNAHFSQYQQTIAQAGADPKATQEVEERVKQAEEAVRTSIDNHREAKEAAADTVTDVSIGALGIGSVIASGGTSIPLILSIGLAGGTIKAGSKAAMLGENYESGSAAKDFASGFAFGATSVLGPGEVAAIFKVGSTTATTAVEATMAQLGLTALKNGAQVVLKDGVQIALKDGAEAELKGDEAAAAAHAFQRGRGNRAGGTESRRRQSGYGRH